MPQVKERDDGGINRGGSGWGGGGSSSPGGNEAFPVPTPKIGLWILLAVLTVLFTATISAYLVRMDLPDWKHFPKPMLLWFNTALLLASSVFLQRSSWAAKAGDNGALRSNLWIGGALGLAFVIGQLGAWVQLRDAGYYLAGNASSTFIYFMTALHAVHVLGGMVAWAVVGRRRYPSALSVELCATYWHFLLLVWLAYFSLLLLT